MEKPKFMSHIASFMWNKRYAKRTIETYLYWIGAYIRFHGFKRPEALSSEAVEEFLSDLVVKRKVSASTQAIALNSLNFLYKTYLDLPLDLQLNFIKSQRFKKLPVVLSCNEVKALLSFVPATLNLPVPLLYGSGLRLMECVRLRTGDVDFHHKSVRIWHGKGGRRRGVTLAEELIQPLKLQIAEVQKVLAVD